MTGKDNVWIGISDLLAGLMAFFVFVSVGIATQYHGLEGIALRGAVKGSLKNEGEGIQLPFMVVPGAVMDKDSILFSYNYFGPNQHKLKKDQKDDLRLMINALGEYVQDKELKILVVGHASCACKVDDAELKAEWDEEMRRELQKSNYTKTVIFWDDLADETKQNERYAAMARFNSTLSIRRAHSIYEQLCSNPAIQDLGEENIRYIGLSEQQAAMLQGDITCQDRTPESGQFPEEARSADVFVVKKWPKAVRMVEPSRRKPH